MSPPEDNQGVSSPLATIERAGSPGSPSPPPGIIPGHFIRRRSDRAVLGSLVVLAVLGLLTLCYFASSVFITILSSILIALSLDPLVRRLCRKARLGRILSSIIVVFLAMAVLYAILYLAYGSARQLFTDLHVLVEQIRKAPTVERITSHVFRVSETLQEAGRNIALPSPSPPPKGDAIILRDSTSLAEAFFRGLGSLTT